jgi:hypothetical protein
MSTTVQIVTRVIRKAALVKSIVFAASLMLLAMSAALSAGAQEQELRTMFRVKYVAEGVVYLDAGNNAGLAEGMKLVIKKAAVINTESGNGEMKANVIVAELTVASVAESSSVCDVTKKNREIAQGDVAYLTQEHVEALVQKRALSSTRQYPMVVSFTEGDPLDEEMRAEVPRLPSPEVNRARGRVAMDYGGTRSSSDSGVSTNSQVGVVIRTEVTRIGGTYWNMSGYWRGRLTSGSAPQQDTVQDLINRTYNLSMVYSNPNSRWVAGVGRMNIPWANSLDTIDGGYFGLRMGKHATTGMFAGSTPNPASWDYDPDRKMTGAFVNFEAGSFDNLRYTGTFGLGVSALRWHIDRPFVFAENSVFYKQVFTVYESIQADDPHNPTVSAGAGVSRSFVTARFQPKHFLTFDVNHNYFRDVPTYDPRLIATGLVDKLLFQGLSVGSRVELPDHITLYANVGRSSKSGDARGSWNTMVGMTLGRIWKTGIRADVRYSQFDSAFGSGNYSALSLSRDFGDDLRFEVQGGKQTFMSPLTTDTGSMFVNTLVDISLGPRYFLEGGYTLQRGGFQNIDQWFTSLGYRFDSKGARR